MRLAVDKFHAQATEMLDQLIAGACPTCKDQGEFFKTVRNADQSTQTGIEEQRGRVVELKRKLAGCGDGICKQLVPLADYLVRKSVWVLGGDGWAYDIGYGGLDHVLASGRRIKLLVLDTEVYSNTGGQASKSTPMGAVARFAAGGKQSMKKDLGMISMTYGNIYVAQIALGANPAQAVKAFTEAEAYDGPALIVAYSHCIAHGFDLVDGMQHQRDAVASGHFPLYRFNPEFTKTGKNPLTVDSKAPTMSYSEHAMKENRFRELKKSNPAESDRLMELANTLIGAKFDPLTKLAALPACKGPLPAAEPAAK